MKKNTIIRLAALMLSSAMTLSLAACGGSDSSSKKDTKSSTASSAEADSSENEGESQAEGSKDITGEVKTWGIYQVLIPDGWTLRGGDVFDDNDERLCSVKKSDFSYFELKCETEDVQQRQYNYNKNTYTLNQADLPATTIAGIEWNGFEYGNELTKGFELYGSSNGRFLRVSGVGFAFGSAEAKAVLGSIKVTEAPAEETSSEAEDSSEDEAELDEMTFDQKATFAYNGMTFKVGDKIDDLREAFGEEALPSQMMTPCVDGAQDVELIYYPGLTIQVNYEGTIITVDITEESALGRDASLACGLKLGDTRETAKKLLGEADDENDYGLTYTDGSKNLRILYHNDEINLISSDDMSLPF